MNLSAPSYPECGVHIDSAIRKNHRGKDESVLDFLLAPKKKVSVQVSRSRV